ncbi:terpenoid synthase [Vararia minispora EC-137]|uniref:Terpenoid synthase n=1 Tax=Vararia minispora EC-137 TaxID=1314806 RepID=A0ACB8QVE4_9AGAM|nr:terpenoid synthase [Vararia minispora EC-137]
MADKYANILSTLLVSPSTSARDEAALLEPYTYLTNTPGKDIRGLMISAFNVWLKVPEEKLKVIVRVIGMLHNASLLVDDIEDDSQLRRGQPVAHKIYGIPQTINSANYVYFLAYKELFALRPSYLSTSRSEPQRLYSDLDLDRIVTDELLNLHRGQGQELIWRDTLTCPTEEEYVRMVNNKTGGLFRLSVKIMMACATTNFDVDYVPLVDLIGAYFQIRDDYMNLQNDQYQVNKGFAEDLTEGKFSFPIVHGVRANPTNRQLLNILQKRPATPTLKNHAISYLRNTTQSFEYTLEVLSVIEKQVREEIARLGGNVKIEAILDGLHLPGQTSL